MRILQKISVHAHVYFLSGATTLLLILCFVFFVVILNASPTQASENEDEYPDSVIAKDWAFENYAYEWSLPEEREGFFYPMAGMAHGIIFPLDPVLHTENKDRYLLIWAYYDLREDEEGLAIALQKQMIENLTRSVDSEHEHEQTQEAVAEPFEIYSRKQAGLDFLFGIKKETQYIRLEALGRRGQAGCSSAGCGIIYQFAMLTTPDHWQEDRAYFESVFTTFALLPYD